MFDLWTNLSGDALKDFAQNYLQCYWAFVYIITAIVILNPIKNAPKFNKVICVLAGIGIVGFITFRPPYWRYFGDTANYLVDFLKAGNRSFNWDAQDIGHEALMQIFKGSRVYWLFLTYALIYVGCQYLVIRKLFYEYRALGFLLLIGSFSFFGYGFNGMRNGAACALVMYGFIQRRLIWQLSLFAVGASLHKSVLLPATAFFVAKCYRKTDIYLRIWFVCLVINALIPNILGEAQWLKDLIQDDRVSYFSSQFDVGEIDSKRFSHTGFRWDFAMFGALPIICWLKWGKQIAKKEKFYTLLFNVYVICNAAWMFTARMPYNNRFAYLSWFLIPLLLLYPFLRNRQLRNNTDLNLLLAFNLIFTLLF